MRNFFLAKTNNIGEYSVEMSRSVTVFDPRSPFVACHSAEINLSVTILLKIQSRNGEKKTG